ncbi:DUF4870 family protein [Tepidiphilus thermophilus]|uniref:Uncharacterized membrane protein n=1 Tax=Tepidiphilus thermophilus TaxID=876478 RepID=A0A0K6IX03_9PROT|nr:hypothetical protein [Tepidiphilus thermophilus]CUB07651.1 Uncharacterized membrane protein [Tepidiphilus thermophilus]
MEIIDAASSNDASRIQEAKKWATVVYALYAISLILGVTYLVGIIVNYVKYPDVRGTWVESHFLWQRRTFWYSLLWSLVGVLTAFVAVGYFILFAAWVWVIYRIVKGWISLSDGKPMYSAPGAV